MKTHRFHALPWLLTAGLVSPSALVSAAQLSLAQAPAGNGGREPAPNIIVSVDDSGSMGTTGIASLKAALNDAFSSIKVADDSIRLGFQAMWRCRGLDAAPYYNYGSSCPDSRIKKFSGTHRTNFNTWVNSLRPWGGTPSHLMIKNAGEFMKTTGVHNPYASDPGTTETPLLACRKSFQIFMTDGGWNSETAAGNNPGSAGNADGTGRTLPDGTAYDVSAGNTQTRVYRDTHGSTVVNTLADHAFDYWATDLQPGIANNSVPIIRKPGATNYPNGGTDYWLQEYWNPQNNPATWQSLTTYTIGFNDAANLPTSGSSSHPWWGGTTWSGGDYPALIRGEQLWGNPITSGTAKLQELWHMALNGRGRFVPATSTAELQSAFNEILNQIKLDTSAPLVSIAATTQTLRTGSKAYVAGYDAANWSGSVKAYTIQSSGAIQTPALWDSATKMDDNTIFSPSTRLVLGHDGVTGIAWTWPNLSTTQKNAIKGADNNTVGNQRVDYVRGDRSQEVASGGALRNRTSRHGDVVNSSLWFVDKPQSGFAHNSYGSFRSTHSSRTPMVYVGANDGMLHGFEGCNLACTNADAGKEKIAYVPLGAIPKVETYTNPAYNGAHSYTIDGIPFTADAYTDGSWKTLLTGFMGGGGKGYFVLDVTNPANFSTATPASLVVMDKTDGSDADIGHIYSEPTLSLTNRARVMQVTRVNEKANGNFRWALIMGNGYNSTNEDAVLLVQFLDGAKELLKISTGADTTNGLSAPQLLDLNSDGAVDVAYAGDLKGNLWKFDLTSGTRTSWSVAYGGNPFFAAKDTANKAQPITTAPTWLPHPKGGLMLGFGTGRDLTVNDRTNTDGQSFYGLWDNATIVATASGVSLTGGSRITSRTSLVEQTQTVPTTISGTTYFTTSTNAIDYATKRGWFIDLTTVRERSTTNPGVFDKRLIYLVSTTPGIGNIIDSAVETCEPDATPAKQYLTLIDLIWGKPAATPVFDSNGDGIINTSDTASNRAEVGALPFSIVGQTKGSNKIIIRPCTNPAGCGLQKAAGETATPARIGWRHLQ